MRSSSSWLPRMAFWISWMRSSSSSSSGKVLGLAWSSSSWTCSFSFFFFFISFCIRCRHLVVRAAFLLLGPLGPVLLVLAAPALLRVVERALVDGHRVVGHRAVPGDPVGVRRRGRTWCLGDLEQPTECLADHPADGGHLGERLRRAELALHQHREDVILRPSRTEPREPREGVDDLGSDGQDHEKLQEGLHVGGGNQFL